MFDIGDKVVCVDAGPKKGCIGPIVPVHHLLREGAVYTVAGLSYSVEQRDNLTGEWSTVFLPRPTVMLAEVVPTPPMKGFGAYRFRKIEPPEAPFAKRQVSKDLETV
jgi:hypothetical protein